MPRPHRTPPLSPPLDPTLTDCRPLSHASSQIAKLLDERCVLISLNLCDNHVHADGGKYFGRAMKLNSSLETLNLRLNRLGDEGGKMLLEGVLENTSLTQLNLSCNALEMDSVQVPHLCASPALHPLWHPNPLAFKRLFLCTHELPPQAHASRADKHTRAEPPNHPRACRRRSTRSSRATRRSALSISAAT